jgi:arsenite oxidase small subunit
MPVSRSGFLRASGASLATAGLAAVAAPHEEAEAADPSVVVGKAAQMHVGKPTYFHYPDTQAPAIAVRLGRKIDGGVGPQGDIVAYSQICVHKGCSVAYNADREVFICPCHYSVYDPAKTGEVVIGHASTKLPRINLTYNASSDTVAATGVSGLIYGRVDNAPLKKSV